MVFHGDYEVEFEIYEKREDDWRAQLLGHMTGINPEDAKARWVEVHQISPDRRPRIEAVPVWEECP
tara:strand:- start:587 stop:784 length:198 start_codon:yes stop_codon:yes gene_type:complete